VSTDSTLANLPSGVLWSVLVTHAERTTPLLEVDADRVCSTASIGKVLLLIATAELIESGALGADALLSRSVVTPVADSGLWQHLDVDSLSVNDLCTIVGATSDNLATNVLISAVGLRQVSDTGRRLGLRRTALHDIVRDHRLPEHPQSLSSGSARDLVRLCRVLHDSSEISPGVCSKVTGWMSTNTDLSMVASAFGLDPLAHVDVDRGVRLWNKTGTNDGVRCDMGVVEVGDEAVTYAVLANWTPRESNDTTRDVVLAAMRGIGTLIRESLTNAQTR